MQNNPYEAPVAEGAGGLSTGRHEFSDVENQTIGTTGRRSWLWGLVALVTGILGLGGLIPAFLFRAKFAAAGLDPNWVTIFIVAMLPIVAVNLMIGAFYMGAGNALKAVVKTQGADVQYMMTGLNKLGSAFFVEFLVGTITLIGAFAAGVALAVYAPELAEVEEGTVVEAEEDFDD